MGKLLQKIVNGVVPSWLTRVKSSAHAKRLLPPASNSTLDHDRSGRTDKNETLEPAPASAESSALSFSVDSVTPLSMPHKKTNMKRKDGQHEHSDSDDEHQYHLQRIHQFKDNNDHHYLHNADMNDRSHGTIYNPATQIHAPNLQADEGANSENRHPQHHRHHEHRTECLKCDQVLLGSEKRSQGKQCMQEDDNSHHHQKVNGGHHEWPNAKHKHSYVSVQEKQKKYHDLLGFKRKSTYSEEDEDEEDKGEGHRSRGIRGWGWKRRKREEGLMSCKLPVSIGSVVGNARAVVKYSQEPHHALWESMVEMIVGNGMWELDSLEFLLFCYLSLNEPHLYSIIQSSFLKVLKDLGRTF